MKKLYFTITLMFMALLASCSQEEALNKETENSRVILSAELPGDVAATRAQISVPATHKLRCIVEVWTKSENPSLKYREEVAVAGGAIPAFDFPLRPGDYTCLMWADFIEAGATTTEVTVGDITYAHYADTYYDTSDLHQITIKDEFAANLFDTDLCDGFYANLEVKKNATTVTKVLKLTRPFAKLIVKENEAEKFATLTGLKVNYEMLKEFNVATGEPGTEKLMAVYEKAMVGKAGSQVLFSGYVFTPSADAGFSLGSSILSFTTTAGRATCEIPEGSITLKRNQPITASGNLMAGGALEPDEPEEPSTGPNVGDFFFLDGTWSAELTDANKADCVGIVYAVGAQAGDNIDNYGEAAKGKSIKGYVMGLKNTDVFKEDFAASEKQYLLSSSRPYFYKQNEAVNAKDESVSLLTKASAAPNWVTYNGIIATNSLLTDNSFVSASSINYPVLHIFSKWKKDAGKPTNASEWYIPSSGQLLEAAGVCYGFVPNTFNTNTAAQTILKNDAFNEAFNEAIAAGIASYFSNNSDKGYHIYTSTLNMDAMPMVIQIGVGNPAGSGRIAPLDKPNYRTMGFIRPVLTIIK